MKEKREQKKRRFPIFRILLALTLAGILCAGIFVLHTVSKAPKISTLDAVPKYYRSTVLDDSGQVALTLSGEESNRVYAKLTDIPDVLEKAVIAIEDERFYEHGGIDIRGIARAFVKGVKNGSFTEGASTITQQLLKNNVFTGWTKETEFSDKLERKIQEQFLAVALEKKVSKEWILENYLNTINLGSGNFGVETAARYYFGKDVSKLSLSEAAVLAATTRNPTLYNPLRNPEKNEERRTYVLANMKRLGYISEAQEAEALSDDVYERIAQIDHEGRSQEVTTYFEDALLYELIGDLTENLGISEESAWNMIYRGGLTIESTENSTLQALLEGKAAHAEEIPDGAQISMVIVENTTGEVKALLGGSGDKDASLVYNRATASVRQPGSTIKVIGPYAAALEAGEITLGSTFDDAPYNYTNGQSIVNASGTYGGMTTVRKAIVSSNNIVALKCFQSAGMETVYDQLGMFGITTLTDADKVEALALGGTNGGVTNLELTCAYSALSRGGTYREPIYYKRVLDRDGKVILENTQASWQAVSYGTAELLTDTLEDVVEEGTGTVSSLGEMASAGKSGTTTGIRDAWFVGYTPYLTCGIWGGYDDNRTQEDSSYVQVIWQDVMEEAHSSAASTEFPEESGGSWHFICTKCGKLAIEGVCDVTEQGDMTAREFFLDGTEPTEYCDCHVAVTLCAHSYHLAGKYCEDTVTKVYLKEATEGTDDYAYVLPASAQTECTDHKSFWEGILEGELPSIEFPDIGMPNWNTPFGGGYGNGGGYEDDGGHGSGSGEDRRGDEEEEEDSGGGFLDWLFGS